MARHQNLSVGELTVDTIMGGASLPMYTKKIFVDPVNGSDGNSGLSISNAKKSFGAGYAMITSAKNEAMILVPGASGFTLTAVVDWTKSASHLIGLSPGRMNNRCKLTTST